MTDSNHEKESNKQENQIKDDSTFRIEERENAMIPEGFIETPGRPVIETPENPAVDGYIKPYCVTQTIWDGYTDQQKKAAIATFNAIKKHAGRHGGT